MPNPSPTPTPSNKGMTPQELANMLLAQKPVAGGSTGTDFYKTFPSTLSAKDKATLQQTMWDLGLYGNTKKRPVAGLWNPDLDGDAFKKVVDIAVANKLTVPGKNTPDYKKVLAIGAADPKAFQQMFFAPVSTGTTAGPSTTISTSKTNFDAQKISDVVNTAYRQAVGRDATAAEIAQALKVAQAAKSSTTTTTTSRNKKGQAIVESVTTPGTDIGQLITQQAKSTPEFGSYQAATTYFDAMVNALRGPAGRGA